MTGRRVIAGEDAVLAVKSIGRACCAVEIAERLGVDSLAVATALRAPCNDGRVSIAYRKAFGSRQRLGCYRFKRMKPAVSP